MHIETAKASIANPIAINNNSKNLHNTNELLGTLEGVYGVKTGFTNGANRCLVTSCKKGNLDIICVVLGCDTKKDRTQDSVKLIKYIFSNFSVVDLGSIINNYSMWLDIVQICFINLSNITINDNRSSITKTTYKFYFVF